MATFPDNAFSIHGGCNCGAVRYTLNFPSEQTRKVALSSEKSNNQGNIRLPQTAACFCNDCRRASGNLVLFVIMSPIEQTSLSLLQKPQPDERLELPASYYFSDPEPVKVGDSTTITETYLSLYQSSDKAMRAFCSRCGTPILYVYTPRPLPPGASTGGLDIYLGTVDRADLEKLGGLNRFAHCDRGIDWVRRLFVKEQNDANLPAARWHPGSNLAEYF